MLKQAFDPPPNFIASFGKCFICQLPFLLLFRRIRQRPVNSRRAARKRGTDFIGAVAEGHHDIEGLILDILHRKNNRRGNLDTNFVHRL